MKNMSQTKKLQTPFAIDTVFAVIEFLYRQAVILLSQTPLDHTHFKSMSKRDAKPSI